MALVETFPVASARADGNALAFLRRLLAAAWELACVQWNRDVIA